MYLRMKALKPTWFWLVFLSINLCLLLLPPVDVKNNWMSGLTVPGRTVFLLLICQSIGSVALPSDLARNGRNILGKPEAMFRSGLVLALMSTTFWLVSFLFPKSGSVYTFTQLQGVRFIALFEGLALIGFALFGVQTGWWLSTIYYLFCVFGVPPTGAVLSRFAVVFQDGNSRYSWAVAIGCLLLGFVFQTLNWRRRFLFNLL